MAHQITSQQQSFSSDRTYIGLSSLLPLELRALCSCAKLFFAEIVSYDETYVCIQVAALLRYFSGDTRIQNQHVRLLWFQREHLGFLLEFDRSLANLATCDLQDLLEVHTTEVKTLMLRQGDCVSSTATPVVSPLIASQVQNVEASTPAIDEEEITYVQGPTIRLSAVVLQRAYEKTKSSGCFYVSTDQLQTIFLQAAFAEAGRKQRQILRTLLRNRDTYDLQFDIFSFSVFGCAIQFDIPIHLAA